MNKRNETKQNLIQKSNAAKRGEHLQQGAMNARVACMCGKRPTIHPTGLCKSCYNGNLL